MECLVCVALPNLCLDNHAEPFSDANQPPNSQGALNRPNSIEVNAISAAQIAKQIHQAFTANLSVPPGNLVALEHDMAVRRTTENANAARKHRQHPLQAREDPANGHRHLALGAQVRLRTWHGGIAAGSHGR
jgi:hypothetical protein